MAGDKLNLAKPTLDRTHTTTGGVPIGAVVAGAGDTLPSDDGRTLDKREWDLAKLAEIGDFQIDGLVWVLSCNNEQTIALQSLLATLAPKLVVAAGPYAPYVATAIGASITYIEAMNRWGGNQGVDINGIVGVEGVIVTPRVGKLWGDLIKAARLGVTGRVIIEFLVNAAAKSPAFAAAYEMSGVAIVVNAVQSGTPIGWAVAAGAGLIVTGLKDLIFGKPEPDINDHGAVMADRNTVGRWETFTMASTGAGTVWLTGWLGLFSAQGGGGAGVYANRLSPQAWETWTLIDNGDGTVSFKTINGHFLCAEEGGGRECQADRTQIGPWEKFVIVPVSGDQIALRAQNGQFVSVQD